MMCSLSGSAFSRIRASELSIEKALNGVASSKTKHFILQWRPKCLGKSSKAYFHSCLSEILK